MKVLCTGIAGFLMSHVADWLLKGGHDVVGIDDLSGGFLENVPSRIHLYNGSVCDADLIKRVFHRHNPTAVVHGAAYAAEGLSPFIRRFNYTNNLVGSMTILNESINHNVKVFVFVSSAAVYGSAPVPFVETETPRPEDPYGIAKWAVEQDLRLSHNLFGLPFVVFRAHNIYGNRQSLSDAYRNVVAIFLNQCMKNEPMTIFGDGTQLRAFSYIDDVAPIIAESVTNERAWQQTINIGADKPYTVNELAEEVARAMDVPCRVVHLPARNEVQAAFSSHARLRHIFGKRETTPLQEGLARMAKWAKQRGSQPTKPFTEIEIRKNLPPSWAKLG